MDRPASDRAFFGSAALLAVGVAAGHALWFTTDAFESFAFVGASCMALGLGWACHAPTVVRAAGRAGLAAWCILVGWIAALAILVAVEAPIDLQFNDLWGSADGEVRSVAFWLVVQFLPFAGIVAAGSAPLGALAWSYGAVPRGRALRLLPAAIVLAPMAIWSLVAWDEGTTSLAISVVACAWLIWAMRRARARRRQRAASGRLAGDAEAQLIAGR